MSITSILRDTPNNVSLVRMISSDTVADVSGVNYIENQMTNIRNLNGGFWQWFETDMIVCSCSDGNAIYEFTDNTFSTLEQYGSVPSGFVTPQQIQNQTFVYSTDSGVANAYQVTLTPAPVAYTSGMAFSLLAGNDNTGASTIQVNSLGTIDILTEDGGFLPAGAILAGGNYNFIINPLFGPAAIIQNPSVGTGATPIEVQQSAFNTGSDFGTANTYQVVLSPGIVTLTDGLNITLLATGNNNSGASTLNANGTPIAIVDLQGNALSGGEMLAGYDYNLIYNSTNNWFVLQNSSLAVVGGVTAVQVQQSAFNTATETGVIDAYIVNLSPPIGSLFPGLILEFVPANSNTIPAPTVTVNGSTGTVILSNGTALSPGDIGGSLTTYMIYDGANFVLLNPRVSYVTALDIQNNAFNSAADGGSVNALQINLTPALLAYSAGQLFVVNGLSATNTGAATLQINSLSIIPIASAAGGALVGGEMIIGNTYLFLFNSGSFVLLNSSLALISPADIQQQLFTNAPDSGIVNAYIGVYSPVININASFVLDLTNIINTNTGASTFDCGGGAHPILTPNLSPLVGGEIIAGNDYYFLYSITTANWILLNSSLTSGGANFPVNTNITSMTGLTGPIKEPTAIQSSAAENILTFNYIPSATDYLEISNNTTGAGFQVISPNPASSVYMLGKGIGGVLLGSLGATTIPIELQVGTFKFTHSVPLLTATRVLTYPDANVTLPANPMITKINAYPVTATGAFSYVPTTGAVFAIFELQAAGGGSGGTTGTAAQAAAAGPGGGGAYMRILVSGTVNLAAITGSIGAAGTAGASGNNAGGNGGNTTLTINAGTPWVAGGGGGGGGQASSASSKLSGSAGGGGTSTTGTNADIIANIPGQNGGAGFSNGSVLTLFMEAGGGDSQLGKGGAPSLASGTNVGVNYGGGAGGFINGSGANAAGLAGAQGVIIVTEFISL